MSKKILFFAVVILLSACNNPGKFSVSGHITDAEGEVLYFEKNGLLKDSLIDSVSLNKVGHFAFKTQLPEYPDLYRLRIKNQNLVIGVDSVVKIEVEATAKDLMKAKITGSQITEKIQHLRQSVRALQSQFDQIASEKDQAKSQLMLDSFRVQLGKHKKETQAMILQNPGSMAAYFALYQQISGNFIFSPYVKEERAYYQAVATTFHSFMPEYERSKNLYTLVMSVLKEDRLAKKQKDWTEMSRVEELGFIEIDLKNKNGYPQKLSSFVGKPILLDFSAYGLESSIDYTFSMREIYDKYASQGLQIYQVSLDQSRLIWERAVSNIPWTCVIDPDGLVAKLYNVQKVPTLYLISKEGTIIGKYNDVKRMEADLSKVL